MEKVWWFKNIRGEQGPFHIMELRGKITPNTWVKRTGETEWKRAKDRFELRFIFSEAQELTEMFPLKKKNIPLMPREVIALEKEDPPFFYFWLVAMILAVGFMLFHFFYK